MKQELKQKLLPLWMTGLVVLVDQISKLIVLAILTPNRPVSVLGDFFRITLRRNPAVIFSLGRDFPPLFQAIFFFILPLAALGLLVFFYFREQSIKPVYRLPLAAILGGGIGNLIDRIFRPDGVVDFLDFTFFGIFDLERWPTFNLADTAIVAGVIVILVIALARRTKSRKLEKDGNKASAA